MKEHRICSSLLNPESSATVSMVPSGVWLELKVA
jgi:hypothetical protein